MTQITVIHLFFILLLTTTAGAQQLVSTLTLLTGEHEKPAHWLDNVPKPITFVYVKGHWMALDATNPVAGFSVSEITCSKPGIDTPHGGCTEDNASIIPDMGFVVSPEHNEYQILNWRDDGLTARYVGGLCKISHTLEIDFKTGSILVMDAPTKVNNSKLCDQPASTYELMDGVTFTVVDKKTAKK